MRPFRLPLPTLRLCRCITVAALYLYLALCLSCPAGLAALPGHPQGQKPGTDVPATCQRGHSGAVVKAFRAKESPDRSRGCLVTILRLVNVCVCRYWLAVVPGAVAVARLAMSASLVLPIDYPRLVVVVVAVDFLFSILCCGVLSAVPHSCVAAGHLFPSCGLDRISNISPLPDKEKAPPEAGPIPKFGVLQSKVIEYALYHALV